MIRLIGATRRILQVLLPLAVIIGGSLGAKALMEAYKPPEKQAVVVEPPLVRVIEARSEPLRLTISAEGSVRPRTESEIVPEVSGKVVWVSDSLAVGGFFAKGDELMKIDRREYELAVVRAQAAVAQAELRLATEEQEAEVARKEWDDLGQGTPTPLVLREPQLAQMRAELASAHAALDQAAYDLERTVVYAPYNGRIRRKQVDVGQYVQRGQSVANVYSTDVAEVILPVPDDQLEYVRLPLAYRGSDADSQGPRVTLSTDFAGRRYSWQGRIVRTEAEIDPQTRMIQAVAQVKDPYAQPRNSSRPPLAVGMYVEAEIEGRSVRTIPLPRAALRGDDTVWVVDADGRIEFRKVDILRLERDRVLISGGVKAGETVCVSTLEAAVDRMQVRVVEETRPEQAD